MTLKEKFRMANMVDNGSTILEKYQVIADDFAIGFADWKGENCFQATGTTLWYTPESNEFTGAYTNKQLLEIYKKEKEL